MKLKDILAYRTTEKCYLIEDREEDFIVVYGTRYRKVEFDGLYDTLKSFKNGEVNWRYAKVRIKTDLIDNPKSKEHWNDLDSISKELDIDAISLFVDGENREL